MLAASGSALAQSSVTLFGLVDAGVAHIKSGNGHATSLVNGGNTTSRLGFRGTEDLGGGFSAGFWLEGALNNDVGGGAGQTTAYDFARRATVSLAGSFGEVRLGRDFAATYLPLLSFDPFAGRGLGSFELYGVSAAGTSGLNGTTRVSNAVSYFLPAKLGGLYGNVQYAFGERNSNIAPVTNAVGISSSAANATTDRTGDYLGGRIGYAAGPLDVVASYGVFSRAVRTVGTSFYADDYKVGNIAAMFDFGFIKPMVLVQTEKIDGRGAIASAQMNSYSLGATAPLGAGVLRAALTRYDLKNSANDAHKLVVGYVYNLSKRTAVYGDIARIDNKGSAAYNFTAMGGATLPGATAGGHVTGVGLGVKHVF